MRYGSIFYIYYLAIYLLDTKYLLKHIYSTYKITIECKLGIYIIFYILPYNFIYLIPNYLINYFLLSILNIILLN